MKINLLLLFVFFGLTLPTLTFADCYGCANSYQASSDNSCSSCGRHSDGCGQMNPCACTDPGYNKNPCLSKREFCKVYGNMGQ